ncbi:MAG: ABC transporter permease [Spirochaetes bacterium]|nr:ABC transporter permease [Spirochaetota bacterium]
MLKIILLSAAIAFDGILTHKLRSFLTMLGIIFGVTAVVAMLAIGAGAEQEILNRIAVMGINNIFVYDVRSVRASEVVKGQYISRGLSYDDVTSLYELVGPYATVIPVQDKTTPVYFMSYKGETKVVATTERYYKALSLKMKEGRFINNLDTAGSQIAVIGGGLYARLKREGEVLGQPIRLRDQWYTVVGVIESKSVGVKKDDNMDYEDFNYNIYVPIDSAIIENPDVLSSEVSRIIVSCHDKELVGKVGVIVERILLRHHRELRDFKIVIPEELLKQHRETQRIFDIVLGCIAGISLLVGGIGIMNIMLASILERTKEIGLCRALGAKKIEIRLQFLLEAVLLTILGGLLGIVLAFIITTIITVFWHMPTKVTMISCVLSFSISALVGIVFGYVPAKQAGDMNPIDALRYE